MDVLLIGAPGAGKRPLAEKLAEKLDYRVSESPEKTVGKYALGYLADYRTELHLATSRVLFDKGRKRPVNMIHTHSLLDNLSYLAHRLDAPDGAISDRILAAHMAAFEMIVFLSRDSFAYDHVFFVPGHEEDPESFNASLEETLRGATLQISPPATFLEGTPKERYDTALKVISSSTK